MEREFLSSTVHAKTVDTLTTKLRIAAEALAALEHHTLPQHARVATAALEIIQMDGPPPTILSAEWFEGPPERPWRTNNPQIAAKLRTADRIYAGQLQNAAEALDQVSPGKDATKRAKMANDLAMAYIQAATGS